MTYQALARKWRPQDFSSVIGQEPIVTALRNALTQGRIAQAYLFSGIRGVGKTTTARVLAKSLNCEKGPAADPCNDCQICHEITVGSDLDVLEVDAATYSKVEQMRELTESLRYGPARDRYKVVVLDEVHRLSRQAFDALLKIVEEPPPHLVFVFATTEVEAVPATILSRCQEFHFRRVPAETVTHLLEELCSQEGIEATPNALRLVARAGEGSVRDAVALLDLLATYGDGKVEDEEATRLVGGFDPALFHRLLTAILAGDRAGVSAVARESEAGGRDPRQLFGGFLRYCRDALRLGLGESTDRIDLPAEEARRLGTVAAEAGYEDLLRLLNQLLGCENLVRRSEHPGLALEIAWLRAAELPKLRRLEELLGGGPPVEPAPGRGPSPSPLPDPPTQQAAPGDPPPAAPPPEAAPPAPRPAPPGPANGGDPGGDLAKLFLAAVSRRRQSLAGHLAEAERLEIDGGELVIVHAADDHWLERALSRPGNRRALSEALTEVWGEDTGWRLEVGGEPEDGAAEEEVSPEAAAATRNPSVQAVLDIFQGTIEAVEPRAPTEEER